jgi:hypothetical protein
VCKKDRFNAFFKKQEGSLKVIYKRRKIIKPIKLNEQGFVGILSTNMKYSTCYLNTLHISSENCSHNYRFDQLARGGS